MHVSRGHHEQACGGVSQFPGPKLRFDVCTAFHRGGLHRRPCGRPPSLYLWGFLNMSRLCLVCLLPHGPCTCSRGGQLGHAADPQRRQEDHGDRLYSSPIDRARHATSSFNTFCSRSNPSRKAGRDAQSLRVKSWARCSARIGMVRRLADSFHVFCAIYCI